MAKFKVGDLVVRNPAPNASKLWANAGPFRVCWVSNMGSGLFEIETKPKGIKDAVYHERNFSLYNKPAAKKATKSTRTDAVAPNPRRFVPDFSKDYYIISLKNADNTLSPASSPAVYTSKFAAETVASIMSTKHPGLEFVVFKAIGSAKAAKNNYSAF